MKNSKLLFMTIVFAFVSQVFSYAKDFEFTNDLKWKVSDKYKYKVTEISDTRNRGKKVAYSKSSKNIEIEVLKDLGDAYLVSWKFGKTVLGGKAAAQNPALKIGNDVFNGFKMKLKISKKGKLVDLVNWKEVKDKSILLAKKISTHLKKNSKMSAEQIKQIEKQSIAMYQTKKNVMQIATKNIRMYFFANGKKYALNKALTYKTKMANQFSAKPFLVVGSLAFDGYSKEKNLAHISWKQQLEPKVAKAIMTEFTKKMFEKSKKPMPKKLPKYDIVDIAEFVVDTKTSWTKKLLHSRSIFSGGKAQSNTIVFEKI